MKTGKLRHKIIIQQSSVTVGSGGLATESWTSFATIYAAVEPLTGREFFEAAAKMPSVTTRFRIRYLAGVTPGMRISYDGKYYDITNVLHINEHREEMHLMTKELI